MLTKIEILKIIQECEQKLKQIYEIVKNLDIGVEEQEDV